MAKTNVYLLNHYSLKKWHYADEKDLCEDQMDAVIFFV